LQDQQNLVHRAKQGDQEAFSQLYEYYFDKIYRYVMVRAQDRIEAEDITQEIFLKAVRSIHSFNWKGIPFSAWLFRIAHNEIIDYLRKKSKQTTVPLQELPVVPENYTGNPHLMVERELEIEQLKAAIKQLTQAQQDVISLRFFAELPIAEVASLVGKNQGAVKALQHSAILALHRMLLYGEIMKNEKG